MNLSRLFIVPLLMIIYAIIPMPLIREAAAMVIVFFLLSFLYSFLVLKTLRVRIEKDFFRAFPGQTVEILITLTNAGFLPSGGLTITDSTGNLTVDGATKVLRTLPPGRETVLSYEVWGLARGLWSLGPLVVEGSDPAGLFPWKASYGGVRNLLLYPPAPLLAGFQHEGRPPGRLKDPSGLLEDFQSIAFLRDYMPGDEIRRLDFMASAKSGHLISRAFEITKNCPGLLVLDLYSEHYPIKNRFLYSERAIDTSASIVLQYAKKGESLGLVSNGRFTEWGEMVEPSGEHEQTTDSQGKKVSVRPSVMLPPGQGIDHSIIFLEKLALLQLSDSNPWEDPGVLARALGAQGQVIFVGPPPDEILEETFDFMARRGHPINLFLVGTTGVEYVARKGRTAVRVGDYGEIWLHDL